LAPPHVVGGRPHLRVAKHINIGCEVSSSICVATSSSSQPESDHVHAEPRIKLSGIFSLFYEASKTDAAFFIMSSGAVFLLGSLGKFKGSEGFSLVMAAVEADGAPVV
jgi:hypothetical protein